MEIILAVIFLVMQHVFVYIGIFMASQMQIYSSQKTVE